MEKIEITLAFDGEKLDALEYALRRSGPTVQKQMDEALRQLYEAKVPGGGPRLPGQQEQAHAAETAAPAYQSCRSC